MPESPLTNASGPLGVVIKLNGKEIPEVTAVKSVRVMRELGRIPTATVAIISDQPLASDFDELSSDAFKIGSDIEISAFWGSGTAKVIFKGVVMSMRLRLDERVGQMLQLTCRDKALALMELRTSGQFLKQKDSDTMSSLISDAGFSPDIAATKVTHDQVFADASRWDLIRLLADRNSMVVDVHDGTVRVFGPDTKATAKLKVGFGTDIIEYDAHINAQRMISKATYATWDATAQAMIESSDSTLSDPKLGNIAAKDIAAVLGKREVSASADADMKSDALTGLAQARMLRANLDAVSGTCMFVGSHLAEPGDMIDIADTGKRFSGTGFISGVVQKIDAGEWTTTVHMGLPLDWASETHGLAGPGAAGITTPMSGLQIGKVIQVHDDPDELDRIQIILPAIGTEEVLVWARLGAPYATNGAGIQFLPEIDDEVLVGFLGSSPNAPVILGALHNPKAARPEAAQKDNFLKKITTKGKLAITFDDEDKILTVETPGGHKITLDDAAENIVLQDSGGSTVTLGEDGITLKSGGNIALEADGDITLTAGGDATITGTNVTCEGDMGFTGKGGSEAELSAGGNTTVKGSMVMIN